MANSDGKGAVGREIAAAAAAAAENDAAQLDMLMPPTRSNLLPGEAQRIEASIRKNRAGRPPGARNIATRQMVEFLRKTMGDPLMQRWRYAMFTPEALSIELGCTKLEALTFLDKLWADLSRYCYAQLAQVDGAGNAVAPRFTMVIGGQNAPQVGPNGQAQAPWLYLEETPQNQALIGQPADVSHKDVSHDDEN
ncbi:hypothetical protein [Bradyrhizobium sp. STM 3557]|uniref:hypothetical protein n=1 Tax=Bradyrhizobium sp. STM 3557 TaxID=578920 RepID=UPI00388E4A3B